MIFNKLSILVLSTLAYPGMAASGQGLRAAKVNGKDVKEPLEETNNTGVGPKAKGATIRITPSRKLQRRLVADHLRKRRGLMETIVEAVEGSIDYTLDEMGREFLGYTPIVDVEAAVERYEDHLENIFVSVDAHNGELYTETVLFDHMHKHHLSSDDVNGGGGLQHTATLEDSPIDDNDEEDGGRRRLSSSGDTIQYTGIYLEEYPNQEFQIVCAAEADQELNCEVYSMGLFVPPPEQERRQLGTYYYDSLSSNQCVPAGAEDKTKYSIAVKNGYSCPSNLSCEAPATITGFSECEQCTKDSDCDFLFEEGGVYHGKTWYYHSLDSDYIIYKTVGPDGDFKATCSSNGNRCVGWEKKKSCFSGSAVVSTPNGPKKMLDLQVNDHVLTASGKFEPVYAFVHRVPVSVSPEIGGYLRIVTEHGNTLDLTTKHMIYVNGNHEHPVEARRVKVGDYVTLLQEDDSEEAVESKVVQIRNIRGKGAFSPLTESGTIVVDGIVASAYSNPNYLETEYIQVFGRPVLHMATFMKWLISPVRVYCTHVDGSACAIDSFLEEQETYVPLYKGATKLVVAAKERGLDGVLMAGVALFVMTFYAFEQTLCFLANNYEQVVLAGLLALGWVVNSRWQIRKGPKQV